MKLVTIDPASRKTGYAVMISPSDLIEAGVLSAPSEYDQAAFAVERTRVMCMEVIRLIAEHKPTAAVIEVPSGKIAGRLSGQRPAGLSVYGFAAGAMFWALVSNVQGVVTSVTEGVWTGGVPKGVRRDRIAMEFSTYKANQARDRGADAADTIGLGLWWFGLESRAKALAKGGEA